MVAKNDITGDLIKTKVNSNQYRENIAKIYGDKVTSGRSRWCNKSQKMLPIHEWYDVNGYPETNQAPMIARAMQEYQSPIDGRIISSKRQRVDDLKRSGCREYEGYESEKRAADTFNRDKEKKWDKRLDGLIERTAIELRDKMTPPATHIDTNWMMDN